MPESTAVRELAEQDSPFPQTRQEEPTSNSDRTYVTNDFTENVFCPTGKGGGIDPTCSPRSSIMSERAGVVIKELRDRFPRLSELPPVTVEVSPGKTINTGENIGLADPKAELYGAYEHGNGKIKLAENIPDQGDITIGGQTVGFSKDIAIRHEYGHHVQDHIGVPTDPVTGKRLSWQNLSRPYLSESPPVVSDYAKLSHKEMFAESFAVYTSSSYARGSLPPPIENFFDVALSRKPVGNSNSNRTYVTNDFTENAPEE